MVMKLDFEHYGQQLKSKIFEKNLSFDIIHNSDILVFYLMNKHLIHKKI